jgi:glycosyltransferase involved in cell wall biosynthesis
MGVDLDCFAPARRGGFGKEWLAHLANGKGCQSASGACPDAANPFYLLYVGRLAREKNLGLLVDLIARLQRNSDRAFHILVAGSGPLRSWFEQEAQRVAPGCAHFLGHIDDRAQLADLYANANAFVHPNSDEPFGIALLEAMASGLPLVAPNSGGVTQYANEGNAWTVPATGESFEKAVREIASDPSRAHARAERALATAAGYGWAAVADSFLELYRALHRLQTLADKQPSISPLFYSTPGNYWGRETAAKPAPDRALARG